MDHLCQAYPYIWNQCSLVIKNHLNTHQRYKAAKKIKDAVELWMMIEETCNSTLTIDSAHMQMIKVDLNLKSVYGKELSLLKYYNVFMAQAKVAV